MKLMAMVLPIVLLLASCGNQGAPKGTAVVKRIKSDTPGPLVWETRMTTEDRVLAMDLGMSKEAVDYFLKKCFEMVEKLPKDQQPEISITQYGHSASLKGPNAIIWGYMDKARYAAGTIGYSQKDKTGKETVTWSTTFSTLDSKLAKKMGMNQDTFEKAAQKTNKRSITDMRFILGDPNSPVVMTVVDKEGSIQISSDDE